MDREGKEMIRNLKVLGLVLGAVFAMSAVGASAASAASFNSETETEGTTTITGTSTVTAVFHAYPGSAQVTCKHSEYDAHITTTPVNPIVSVVAIYSECHATIFQFAANVNMGSCTYTFSVEGSSPTWGGKAGVECSNEAEPIVISVPSTGCEIEIGSQSELSGMSYTNVETEGRKDIAVSANIEEEIASSQNAACPGGERNNTEGSEKAEVTMMGVDGLEEDTGIYVE